MESLAAKSVFGWGVVAVCTMAAAPAVGASPSRSDDGERRRVAQAALDGTDGDDGGRRPRFRRLSRDSSGGDSESAGEGGSTPDWSEMTTAELESRARERETDGSYPWHERPREVDGDVDCPDVEVVEYVGKIIRYNRPVEVNPHFRERLVRFERLVREVAVEVYGRAPDAIVQRSGYNCRTVGRNGEKLSEHAFGHAIDIAGFDFEDVSGEAAEGLEHERAADAFEVRLGEHWNGSGDFASLHREFLRRLATVLERRGPFSTMLGPGYPNHDRLFHFDFGPEFFFRID